MPHVVGDRQIATSTLTVPVSWVFVPYGMVACPAPAFCCASRSRSWQKVGIICDAGSDSPDSECGWLAVTKKERLVPTDFVERALASGVDEETINSVMHFFEHYDAIKASSDEQRRRWFPIYLKLEEAQYFLDHSSFAQCPLAMSNYWPGSDRYRVRNRAVPECAPVAV